MQAMSTSVNLHGADGDECGQHGAEGGDFFLHVQCAWNLLR